MGNRRMMSKQEELKELKEKKKTRIIIGIFIGFIVVVVIFGIKNLDLYERIDVDEYNDIFNKSIEDKGVDDEDTDDSFLDMFDTFIWLIPLVLIGFMWVIQGLINPRSSFRRMFR